MTQLEEVNNVGKMCRIWISRAKKLLINTAEVTIYFEATVKTLGHYLDCNPHQLVNQLLHPRIVDKKMKANLEEKTAFGNLGL